jgi:tetratricopeptide (TPR) repeat protein
MADESDTQADESKPASSMPPSSGSGLADRIAVEALRADGGAGSEEARAFLRKHTELVDLQVKHFENDYMLRRLGERVRIGIQILFVITGVVLVAGAGALVWSASRSESVVVDAFDAPPALAQRGETDRVVAGDVLDELTKLQSATRSAGAKKSLSGAWAGDIKVEIPDTGVSLGEVERLLKDNLGHDLHIGGALVQTPDGALALTVRGDGVLPKTFTGADLPTLTRQAAEYIYGEAEPYLYATYLIDMNRNSDAVAFLAQAYPRARDADRPDLANAWGNAFVGLGRLLEAGEKYRLTISLNQHYWKAWSNLIGSLPLTEGEEAAYRAAAQMRALAKASPPDDQPLATYWENYELLVQDWGAEMRELQGDAALNNGAGAQNSIDGPGIADAAARLHDWQGVEKYLAASDPGDPITKAEVLLAAAYQALDRGDYAAAIAPLETFYKQWQSDPNVHYANPDQPCMLGLSYAMTGRTTEADAVFARMGRWQSCYSYRADGLDHAGDWKGAVAAYRAAIALAPDLPFAFDRWGLALLRHGDLGGAAAAFKAANTRGPHWAEPLKHWGDVLLRQHRFAEAVAKYDEALKVAPHWDALNAARASAAKKM